MEQHVYLCQRAEVAERVQGLGYTARVWNINLDPKRYADRSIILVPDKDDPVAALEVALITEQAFDAGASAVRILDYPKAPYIDQAFNLSRERLPHDLLVKRILDRAAAQEPIRTKLPDILDLCISKQFAGEPPEQRWLVGAPAGYGGLLPDAVPILLAGRGGIGKTHSATELALLVGTWDGQQPAPRWMGQPIRKAGPSVVITYEETCATMHRKIHMLCRHHGIPLERGDRTVVISMIDGGFKGEPLIAPEQRTRALAPTTEYGRLTGQLRRLRDQHGPLGVIVLDHVLRAFPIEGNSATDVNSAMALAGRWAAEFACPVVALAHTKKIVMTRDMGDEEILQAVLGSTGWVSAGRATMVMWQLEEKDEEETAKELGDTEFKVGVTRRRYIHAQVLKHNTDDIYEGRLTLRRQDGGLEDVSERLRVGRARARGNKAAALAQTIGRQWQLDQPLQKSGTHGVFECRDRLGKPWSEMSKNELRGLIGACLNPGLLMTVSSHPAFPRAKQANWLPESHDTAGEKLVDELLERAVRQAWAKGRPFTRVGKNGFAARKDELPRQLQMMDDEHLAERAELAAMTGKFDAFLHPDEGSDAAVHVYRPHRPVT